jgi:hypothetical protein
MRSTFQDLPFDGPIAMRVMRDDAERRLYDRWPLPLLRHGRTPTSMLPYGVLQHEHVCGNLLTTIGLWSQQVTGYYTQLGACHGPAGGEPAAGVGVGVPAERIPRGKPPKQLGAAGRGSPQDTGTQTSTFL